MPKLSKLQPGFSAGEISKQVEGRTDQPRYEVALQTCQNYLPIVQGPLIRRPGTKFVCYVKDSTKLPVFIPFQFAVDQNYQIEAGDKYFRFFTNEGRIVTNTTVFSVAGLYGQPGNNLSAFYRFTGLRSAGAPGTCEVISQSSIISSGTILELPTPYNWSDVKNIKFAQKQDTLYLTHPNYQPMKLVRTGLNNWDLKAVIFQDGPYMPLKSYRTIADSASMNFAITVGIPAPGLQVLRNQASITVNPVYTIVSAVAAGSTATTITTSTTPAYHAGDRVFIAGAGGATELNNVTRIDPTAGVITNSSPSQAYWTVLSSGTGSSFVINAPQLNAYTGSAVVAPALLQLITGSSGTSWADVMVGSSATAYTQGLRNISIYQNGARFWGHITDVTNAAQFRVDLGLDQNLISGTTNFWSLGTYNLINGFPSAVCFHQDRLVFNGPPAFPQEIDASMTASYELFSANGSALQVNANNALQFNLTSQDVNGIRWLKSNSQGLLCGSQGGEWAVAPSSQGAALSPTNITANQVTSYGSADTDAILVGNAALYIQRAQRKVRELLYYWQVGNFKSTNITELAQHITIPSITQIVNQKEPHSIVWGLRGDGQLLSLTYNRDEVTLQANAGWARHSLGGRSDAANTPPTINSLSVIPSGDSTYDQLWMVTKRYMNGSTLGCVEYMTKPFDDNQPQEESFHFDCGVTYNSSILVTGITNGSTCVVVAPNHGLTNSTLVRFYGVVGMTVTSTDVNGNVNSTNQMNYQTFMVTNAGSSVFFPQDLRGQFLNTNSSSVYVGSGVLKALVSSISGLGYLAGEQVSVLADGGIHVNTSVTQAGVLNLSYPAAVVQIGYNYNSDGKLLRTHEGSAQGTSIGSTRRVNRVAFMLHNVGDFSFGPTFTRLIPAEFYKESNSTDTAAPLFDGIHRDGIESAPDQFTDTVCFRQNSGLPGMVQSVVRFLEENDV